MFLQVIIVILILAAWIFVLNKFLKKKINLGELLFWSALWFVLLVTSLFQNIPTYVSGLLGIGRGVDLIIYASIFMLFFMTFKLYVRMEEQEKNLTLLVREVSIKRARKK